MEEKKGEKKERRGENKKVKERSKWRKKEK